MWSTYLEVGEGGLEEGGRGRGGRRRKGEGGEGRKEEREREEGRGRGRNGGVEEGEDSCIPVCTTHWHHDCS